MISCWNKPAHLGRLRIESSIATDGSVAILPIRQVDVTRCEMPIYPRVANEAIQSTVINGKSSALQRQLLHAEPKTRVWAPL